VSGGKNTIGHFPIMSSLLISQSSLSVILTQNTNSHGIAGTEKNVYGIDDGVAFNSSILSGSSLL
jgi:hypothetical protein